MASGSNKHKAQGKAVKTVPVSWWTPERVKAAIAVAVVLVLVAIGIGCYMFVNSQQDSITGMWHTTYDNGSGDSVELVYVFGEDKSVQILRSRDGEPEALLTGVYDIDEKYNNKVMGWTLAMSVGTTSEDTTDQYFAYTCKGTTLNMKQILGSTSSEYKCTKLSGTDADAAQETINTMAAAASSEAK